MKRLTVKNLWMNRPWLFADQTIKHFHGGYTVKGLYDKMREMHPYLVELEELAAVQGTQLHDVFQGTQIGNWTVLAPSKDRYVRLIPDLDKTPTRHSAADALSSVLSKAYNRARDRLYETWDIETLSEDPEPTSASNETSIVQFAEIDGRRLLLTADAGPAALNEAADYAALLGRLKLPHMVQIPHHGSRRNVVPTVLDRWLGGRLAKSMSCGIAICSVGENKQDFPRGQVSNAFLRRGYPVYVTRGNTLMHSFGSARGWPSVQPLPFFTEVEDKAA